MMTADQFDALAVLLRSREPAKETARLMLVEGKSRKDAIAITGLSGPAASQAAKRFKEADALVRPAYANCKENLTK